MDKPLKGLEEHEALKAILAGTSRETGRDFFRALVKTLAEALHTTGAWVTRLDEGARELDSFALWINGGFVDTYRYAIEGTPCEDVIGACRRVHVPENVIELYPKDADLRPFKAVSYLGVPLVDHEDRVVGNLAVIDSRPMPEDPKALAIIDIFAARAAAEVARLRVEDELRDRERELQGLLDSAHDAIVQLDDAYRIVRANRATEKTFRLKPDRLGGTDFLKLLGEDAAKRFRRYAESLGDGAAPQSTWVSGGLEARRGDGTPFPAEASLARFVSGGKRFVTVILRDVNDRLEAERRISSLQRETEALRDELRAVEGGGEILGGAPCLLAMLDDIAQVAPTDATVLIQGETGTGKELVARAIHTAGKRRDRALVKVNCGAIPATLIESELFGHEKGAFTGATARRDGRFLAADGGTLFLDEIGELPLELQVKLLRVLQEGEFEPVGSSRTQKVDVRVIAATNRDLEKEVEAGHFRADLFYRLNVFPLRVPPLRERKEDIGVLAAAFVERVAAKVGRKVEPLGDADVRRLQACDWPGNIRELQNTIERGVITARDGKIDLERALPGAAPREPERSEGSDAPIRTAKEMEQLERENLIRALEAANWKVAGDDGAAARLGLKPSTLNSRLRALGIERPR